MRSGSPSCVLLLQGSPVLVAHVGLSVRLQVFHEEDVLLPAVADHLMIYSIIIAQYSTPHIQVSDHIQSLFF
jgi:hypothetical protein